MDSSTTKTDSFISALGIDRSKCYLFFETVILAKGLTVACHTAAPVRAPPEEDQDDDSVGVPRTYGLDKLSDCYLNKLALLCSNTPAAGDISAVALLRHPETDRPFYLIGSNNRKEKQIYETEAFIRSLFDTLNVDDAILHNGKSRLENELMRRILLFHQNRMKTYLNGVINEIRNCMGTDEHHPINTVLKALLSHTKQSKGFVDKICDKTFPCTASNEELVATRQQYTSSIQTLFPKLEVFKRKLDSLYDRSRPGTEPSTWATLLHYIGRMLSYASAPEILIATRQAWPELFTHTSPIDLVFIPSSTRMPNPFPPKKRNSTAAELINRVFNNVTDRETCLRQAERIQFMSQPSLDSLIKVEFEASSFRPCLHCEILLHDRILRLANGHVTPEMFFFGRRYIGVGKPTCRLCWLYISNHPCGIGVRKSHGNIYPGWRMPDCYADVDVDTERERLEVIERIKGELRVFCKLTLGDRQARRKERDSETTSSRPSILLGDLFLGTSATGRVLVGGGNMPADRSLSEWGNGMQRWSDWSPPDLSHLVLGKGRGKGLTEAGAVGLSRPPSSMANETISWGVAGIEDGFAKLSVERGSSTSRWSTNSNSSVGPMSRSTSGGEGSSLSSPRSSGDSDLGEDDDDDGGGVVIYRGRGKRK